MSWNELDFEQLGRKVRRAAAAMAQIEGVGEARGVRVTVDAENRLLSVDVADADAILEAYNTAMQNKQPKVEAAMQELRSDPRFESVTTFIEAHSAAADVPSPMMDDPPTVGSSTIHDRAW